MAKELHPDHFTKGVLLNLVMLNAHTMAVVRHGPDEDLDPDEARSIAGEAWGIVTANFLVFDDAKGTLAKAYGQYQDEIIKIVGDALLVG